MAGGKRLRGHQDRRAALVKEMEGLLETTNERDLTEEEQTSWDEMEAESTGLDSKITRETRLLEHQAAFGKVVQVADGTEGLDLRHAGDMGNAVPAFVEDPKKGFRTPREFLAAVAAVGPPGSEVTDDRLRYLATAGSDEAGTYSDPYGNFLVPTGFLPTLLQRGSDGDPTAGRTTAIPMQSPQITIPARTDTNHSNSVSGGLRVYRRSETQSVTASRIELEQVKLSATPLMGLSYATEELMTDSAISFAALVQQGFQTEFPSKILYEKIHGTGAGQMEGVINCPAVITADAEDGQAADTITFSNIVEMRSRCWGYQNAIWLYNHDCLPTLSTMYIPIGTAGVPAWVSSAREGEPDMLWGRPAFASEYCSAIGDVGDLILGNWSQYLEGTYQPLESAESMHVRFETNERTFRFMMRNDGRCWWRVALTPKKSTVTLSPFVILEAR